jgi:lipase chaperone LimK
MDSKQAEQLLEKYWNCETTLEEERTLRDYFRGQVPENLIEVANLFRYFESQQKNELSNPDFDAQVKQQIRQHRPKGKIVNLAFALRIAAGLLVVVAATYFVREEIRKSYPTEVADTYSDPQLALEETKKALLMLSKGFNKAQKEAGKLKVFNEAEQKIQGKVLDSESETEGQI